MKTVEAVLGACLLLAAGTGAPGQAVAAEADLAGSADFNGDGYADLAVSAMTLDVGGAEWAGGVYVLVGTATGISGVGSTLLSRRTPGVPRPPAEDEKFGEQLAWGDFDGDGFDDLAVGATDCCVGDATGAGSVTIIPGSPAGLTGAGSALLTERTAGVPGSAHTGDLFGASLAVADFDLDGRDDLAVGVPRDERSGVTDAGTARVFYGSDGGLGAGRETSRLRPRTTQGLEDFAAAIAAGDFDGDGHPDLAVGAPSRDVRGVEDAGMVHVFSAGPTGLEHRPSQRWSAGSPGLSGPLAPAGFGTHLTTGDLDGDARDDLVAGASWEDAAGGSEDYVRVLFSSGNGLVGTGSQLWTPDGSGIPVGPRTADGFGDALLVADLTGDGHNELILSHTGDYIAASDRYGGSVFVLRGAAGGPTADGVERWNQDSPGIGEEAEDLELFGAQLVASDVDRDGTADLITSAPFEWVGDIQAGMVQILFRSADGTTFTGDQRVSQLSRGIEGEPHVADRFGLTLAG